LRANSSSQEKARCQEVRVEIVEEAEKRKVLEETAKKDHRGRRRCMQKAMAQPEEQMEA